MAEIVYRIQADGPLAINSRKPGGSQYQDSYDFIPGAAIRGALAAQILPHCQDRLNGKGHETCPQPALCRAILEEDARFRNAILTGIESQRYGLLPATACECKDDGGFANRSDPLLCNKKHGIFDTLIDRSVWEEVAPPALLYSPVCPICSSRTKTASGPYSIERDARYYTRSVARELFTRVAINRRRAVAEDELLYSVSAITERTLNPLLDGDKYTGPREQLFPPTCFHGSIWLPDESAADEIVQRLEAIQHVGSGQSRGLGRVKVKVVPHEPVTALADRLDEFNGCYQERMALWDVKPQYEQYFSITLQSDTILSLDGWTPSMRLEPSLLWRAIGESGQPPDLTLLRSYTTPTTRGGWNSLHGLRKESATCVEAGSVYLYGTQDLASWREPLEQVEAQGVGARRVEGFGQARICDEIHYSALGKVL